MFPKFHHQNSAGSMLFAMMRTSMLTKVHSRCGFIGGMDRIAGLASYPDIIRSKEESIDSGE